MNVEETLERAMAEPQHVRLADVLDAQRWVWRAHNHINRRAPHLRRLMIVRRWNTVTVMLPQLEKEDA